MTLIGSYVDQHGLVVTVSMEATRQGSYLVVKDRWRSPLQRSPLRRRPMPLRMRQNHSSRMNL